MPKNKLYSFLGFVLLLSFLPLQGVQAAWIDGIGSTNAEVFMLTTILYIPLAISFSAVLTYILYSVFQLGGPFVNLKKEFLKILIIVSVIGIIFGFGKYTLLLILLPFS